MTLNLEKRPGSNRKLKSTYRCVFDVVAEHGPGIPRPNSVALPDLIHGIREKNVGMAPNHLSVTVLPIRVAFALHFETASLHDAVDVLFLALCNGICKYVTATLCYAFFNFSLF